MRKFLMIIMAAALSLPLCAKSMRDVWVSMPDSMIPYLDKNMRIELADFMGMKVKAEVKNQLDENTEMTVLSPDFMSVSLNESMLLQMKMLSSSVGDSILCVVSTVKGPESESEISFFTQDWKKTSEASLDLSQYVPSMIAKPDTMSEEKFEMLKTKLHPIMIEASLSKDDNDMTLMLNLPLLLNEEKTQLKSILMQRKLKWNGKTFN